MKPQSLPILVLLLCLAACSARKDALWLQKAERFYADKQTDSTLTYLNKINPAHLKGEDAYTYRLILSSIKVQPLNRQSLEEINSLSQHYERRKDTANLRKTDHIKFRLFLYNQAYGKADSMLRIMEKEAIGRQQPDATVYLYACKAQLFKHTGENDSAWPTSTKR